MKEQNAIQSVTVTISNIELTITIENLVKGQTKGLFFAKCGHLSKGKPVISAGMDRSRKLAIEKCISEFCERVALIYCIGDSNFIKKQTAPFLIDIEIQQHEKYIKITNLFNSQDWIIPISLFNPHMPNIHANLAVDGTGFAAHVDRNLAINHSLNEIYERHCLNLMWGNWMGVRIFFLREYELEKNIQVFLEQKDLRLDIIHLLIDDGIPLVSLIAVITDRKGRCYFGAAARDTVSSAAKAAVSEGIMMFQNINIYWKQRKINNPRIKELIKSRGYKQAYYKFFEQKKTEQQPIFFSENLEYKIDRFRDYFGNIYYKDIGIIHNRIVLKLIVPSACIRNNLGFQLAKNRYEMEENILPFPFG